MNVQNAKNLTIEEGDVKTIHDKDNQLLWGAVGYDTKYAGDTFQQTYNGKNLFNKDTATSSSAAYWLNQDGTISTSATNSGGWQYMTVHLDSSSYTLSYIPYLSNLTENNVKIVIKDMDADTYLYNSWDYGAVSGTRYSHNFTVSEAADIGICICPQRSIPAGGSFSFDEVQIETGSTATTYEPYVGGTASPNPDYPQAINVVTGEQTVKLTGKNLFDKNTVVSGILNGDGTIGSSTQYSTSDFIMVVPNTVYYKGLSQSGRFKYYAKDKTPLSSAYNDISNAGQAQSFTTPNDAYWIRMSIYNDDLSTLQVEKGSTATTYAPYIGTTKTVDLDTLELCKIGTYQDYIYKSGGDWYVHKEIGKVVFDGTENWVDSTTQYTGYYTAYETTKGKWGDGGNFASADRFITDYFQSNGGSFSADFQFISSTGYASFIRIKQPIASTAAELTAWLSTHNTTVYYVLATPTDTKITASDLIDNLNSIQEWMTRYGYEATVSGNLPLIILQTTLS